MRLPPFFECPHLYAILWSSHLICTVTATRVPIGSKRFQTIPNDFNFQLPMMKTKSSKGFQYVPNGVRVSSIPFRCPVFRLDVRYSIRASSILLGCPVSLVAFHFLHVSGEEVTFELHSPCHESSNRFQTIPNDSKWLQTLLRCPTVDIDLNEIRKEVKTLG